ncbi:MAG: ABC transporter permease [Eubacteriales bacterium]|nr:ABC transporter permease [Eubacteriales bacterium]
MVRRAIAGFKKYRYLLMELVKKGITLKYRRSYLGLIWTLIEPLLTMVVLTVVFGTLLGNKETTFPVYILCGRLLYSMFSSATTGAMKAIRANGAMIKKVYVPKYLYPLSSVLFNYVIFLLSLIVLFVVALALKIRPTIYLLQGIVPMITILLLSLGVGMILGTFSVFFRDLEYLWNVALMLIMYMCAIFYYPERLLTSGYSYVLKYNPLYCIIANFRSAVFGEPMNIEYAIYAFVFSLVSIVIGFGVFYKEQDKFVLHI